jgi:hypothetical protein
MAQQFPKDRFDVVPTDLDRIGAHRAPRHRWRGLLWLVWCLVAILVIVGAGWIYLHVLDRNLFGGSAEPQPTITETRRATPTVTPTPTATPTATPTPTATMVPSTTIKILNGVGRAGLAADAKNKLQTAGWTTVSTGDAKQLGVPTTTVYYSDPTLRGVALGVAQSLGTTAVAQSDEYASEGTQLTVVLGADYSG